MVLDRILFPIVSLGPGKRLVIWTCGCSKHCVGCANPELWERKDGHDIPNEKLVDIIHEINRENTIEGITFTGGDPLEQVSDLLEVVKGVRDITEDILIYTGFLYSDLDRILGRTNKEMLEKNVAVLIDGRYDEALNDGKCVLRGSTNQKIYYFKELYKPLYQEYHEQERKIQNVYMGKRMISVGIHND